VCLQNGVGNEELLDSALPGWGIIAAAVTTSLGLDSTEVHVYKRGGMAMAPLVPPGDVDRLAACLTAAGVESVTHENYRAVKWSKLLLNIVCNATCAILNWSPARVLADRRLLQLEREAVGEALAVMAALGLKPVPLPGYPLPSALKLRHLPDWLLGPVVRLAAARGRGGKPPSLLQDLSAARHHLEVDVLNGAVAQHAHQLGVPAPVNEALAGLLGDIADGGRPWHEFRDRPAALLAEVARYRTAPGAPTVSASP
jgi:2-dehydropantoate 2-reductase